MKPEQAKIAAEILRQIAPTQKHEHRHAAMAAVEHLEWVAGGDGKKARIQHLEEAKRQEASMEALDLEQPPVERPLFREPTALERRHAPDSEPFVMSADGHRHTTPICGNCNHGRNYHGVFQPQATLEARRPCNHEGCGCQNYTEPHA